MKKRSPQKNLIIISQKQNLEPSIICTILMHIVFFVEIWWDFAGGNELGLQNPSSCVSLGWISATRAAREGLVTQRWGGGLPIWQETKNTEILTRTSGIDGGRTGRSGEGWSAPQRSGWGPLTVHRVRYLFSPGNMEYGLPKEALAL